MLLYGSESWVVMGEMLKVLDWLHNRLDRRMMGMMETRGADGEWEYHPVVAALEAAGLHPIMEYTRRR